MPNGSPCPDSPKTWKEWNLFRSSVGILYIAGSFLIYWYVLSGKVPVEWRTEAGLIIGALIAKSGNVLDFCFNSTQGSEKKTEMMVDAAKTAAKEAAVVASASKAEVKVVSTNAMG